MGLPHAARRGSPREAGATAIASLGARLGANRRQYLSQLLSGNPLPRGVSVLPFPLSPFPPRPEAPLAAAPAHATMVKHRRGRPVFVVLGTGPRGRQWQGRSSSRPPCVSHTVGPMRPLFCALRSPVGFFEAAVTTRSQSRSGQAELRS